MRNLTDKIQKQSFSRIDHHLIHNILNPINGLILYLENYSQNDNLQKIIAPISEANSKIRNFIRALSSSFHSSSNISIVNIEHSILDILEILKPKILNKSASVNFIRKYENNLVVANNLEIYQLFLNLISNALDAFENNHLPKNQKNIINITMERDWLGNLFIKVRDNGCGMPEEFLSNIFEEGFSNKMGGIGLGLSNIKKITEQHLYGSISVESIEGEYTCFTIKIPNKRILP